MNKNLWKNYQDRVLELFTNSFESNNIDKLALEDFEEKVKIEFIVFVSINKILRQETFTFYDISAVFSGHYDFLEINSINSKYIYMLRKLFPEMKSMSKLTKSLIQYEKLSKNKEFFCYPFTYFKRIDDKRFQITTNNKRQNLHNGLQRIFNEILYDRELLNKERKDLRMYDPIADKDYTIAFFTEDKKRHVYGFKGRDALPFVPNAINATYMSDNMLNRPNFDNELTVNTLAKKSMLSTKMDLTLQPYRTAAKRLLELQEDNEYPESKKRDWISEANNIKILDHLGDVAFLDYSKPASISGAMAQGKSTFVELEIERLLRVVKNVRVGLLTDRTDETIDEFIKYRLKGYKVTIIVGSKDEKKHLLNRLRELQSDKDNLQYKRYRDALQEALGLLGGNCQIHQYSVPLDAISKDEDKPCHDIVLSKKQGARKNVKNVTCPFFSTCGIYNRHLTLKESEIWIGTSQATLKSKAPRIVDINNRPYYELMKEYCDVIFADESDQKQDTFDDQGVEEEPVLYKSGEDIFGKMKKAYYEIVDKIGQDIRTVSRYYDLYEMIYKGEKALNYLCKELKERSYFYKEDFHNHTFKGKVLLRAFLKRYSRLSDNIEGIEEAIRIKYQDSLVGDAPIYEYEKLFKIMTENDSSLNTLDKEVIREEVTIKAIEKWFNNLGLKGEKLVQGLRKTKSDTKGIIKVKESIITYFFSHITMYLIEYYYFNSKKDLENITDEYRVYPDVYSSAIRTKFFMETSSTLDNSAVDFYLKYENDKKTMKDVFEITIVQNTGIGRSILFDYEFLNGKERGDTATEIFLSATSEASSSTHYNIDLEQEFLLVKESASSPIIKQFILEKSVPVSGSMDLVDSMKMLNAKNKDVLQNELRHWEDTGVEKAVVIVVNSYKQAFEVAKHLSEIIDDETVKVGFYSKTFRRSEERDNLIGIYSKEELKNIQKTGINIFVTPLRAINRGYNILRYMNGNIYSYFGSIFFYIRPVVTINLGEAIKIINGYKKEYYNEARSGNLVNGAAWSFIQQRAREDQELLVESRDSWMEILRTENENFIKSLGWYTFVNCYQMIGRLYRGVNPNLRIFWADYKFISNYNDKETKAVSSNTWFSKGMLELWLECLEDEKKNNPIFFEHLYSPFYESLKQEVKKGELIESPFY